MLLRLSLGGRVGNRQLVLTRWLYHPEVLAGNGGTPSWQPLVEAGDGLDRYREIFGRHILLSRVERFELAYYGSKDPGEEPGWHEDWKYAPHLPRLVRIRLLVDSESWPDMVVKLVGADRLRL